MERLQSSLHLVDLMLDPHRALLTREIPNYNKYIEGHEALVPYLNSLATHSPWTFEHSIRTSKHAEAIAQGMGLSEDSVRLVTLGALFHDIGKIFITTDILDSPYKLTPEHLAIMREHPVRGAAIVAGLGKPDLAELIKHHHSLKSEGAYPENAPLTPDHPLFFEINIVAAADTYDGCTARRPYHTEPLTLAQTRFEFENKSNVEPNVIKITFDLEQQAA